jgi:hypothetical protein
MDIQQQIYEQNKIIIKRLTSVEKLLSDKGMKAAKPETKASKARKKSIDNLKKQFNQS